MSEHAPDFLIVGAGIVGLTMAREILRRFPDTSMLILEKEKDTGAHASGRNSGVLHSGIYYPEDSLKSRVCTEGARAMTAYCLEHSLPRNPIGKCVIPTRPEDVHELNVLQTRAERLGIVAERLDEHGLRQIEPDARPGPALYLPEVAVIEPLSILRRLAGELGRHPKCSLAFGEEVTGIQARQARLKTRRNAYSFGCLINAAGSRADRLAHLFGLGGGYTVLPFRGGYYKLSPDSGISPRRLIYPVPDSRLPFLGIHFTRAVDGTVHIGPSAMPAFGREHYGGLTGLEPGDSARNLVHLVRLLRENRHGFQQHVRHEAACLFRARFAADAARLVPALKPEHLLPCGKVGIRPQLYDRENNSLVMDFVVEKGANSLHILNSISPAFTSAFGFARLVVEREIANFSP